MKDSEYKALYEKAHAAGMAAGTHAKPTPMIVGQATTLFGNQIDYSKPTYYEADGVCGFAYLHIRPTRGGFASWLKKNGIGRHSSYDRCWAISVRDFNQSLQRKEAYAEAFAAVVRAAGINISVDSRMD